MSMKGEIFICTNSVISLNVREAFDVTKLVKWILMEVSYVPFFPSSDYNSGSEFRKTQLQVQIHRNDISGISLKSFIFYSDVPS